MSLLTEKRRKIFFRLVCAFGRVTNGKNCWIYKDYRDSFYV